MREKHAGVLQEEYAKQRDICLSPHCSNFDTAVIIERRPLSASSLLFDPRRRGFRSQKLQHRQVLHRGTQRPVRVALVNRLQDLLDRAISESSR